MNNNNSRRRNKKTAILNKLRSMTVKNFKRNENHNENHREKLRKEREEIILDTGYFRLSEIMYYDMSKSEQGRVQRLAPSLPLRPHIIITKKFTEKVESYLSLFKRQKTGIQFSEKISKDYNAIMYLYNELKTKAELNEEAIELGTESYNSFPKDILIIEKYKKEKKNQNDEREEKKRKKDEEEENKRKKNKEEENKRKKNEEEEKKRKEESRLNDETENKAEIHVKNAIDDLVKHLHTHVKHKKDMHAWSATEYNPRTSITGPYEGTYAVRQGLKKYKEEWEKYYNTLAY
jgi:hypothetical protein